MTGNLLDGLDQATLGAVIALVAALFFALSAHVQNMGAKTTSTQVGTLVLIGTQAAIYSIAALFIVKWDYWTSGAVILFAAAGMLRPTLSIALWIEGIKRLGPTLNAALTSSGPVFAAIFGILILGETLTGPIAAGIALVVAGVLVPTLMTRGIMASFPAWAVLLPLGASALRNVAHAITKVGFAEIASPLFAALVGSAVSLVLVAGQFLIRQQRITGQLRDYRYFALSGMITALAVYLLNQALELGQVITVAPLIASSPVFSALLGYFVFGRETLNWRTLLTIGFVVPGVVLIVRASG
jgi:DME family drug/metabolite transporter